MQLSDGFAAPQTSRQPVSQNSLHYHLVFSSILSLAMDSCIGSCYCQPMGETNAVGGPAVLVITPAAVSCLQPLQPSAQMPGPRCAIQGHHIRCGDSPKMGGGGGMCDTPSGRLTASSSYPSPGHAHDTWHTHPSAAGQPCVCHCLAWLAPAAAEHACRLACRPVWYVPMLCILLSDMQT